jgi:hypothetical protein
MVTTSNEPTFFRNDAAIEKARSLSEQHGINASAYQVDGRVYLLSTYLFNSLLSFHQYPMLSKFKVL